MKRLVLLATLLALVLGMASMASAAQIKASGQWVIEAIATDNFDFDDGTSNSETDFNIYQRARTQFEFIANENLKGVLQTEIGTERWGNGAFEFGASAVGIEVRRAYVQFNVPGTKIATSAGYQQIVLPNSGLFGGSNIILDEEMASVATNIPIMDEVGLTMGYGRLYDAAAAGTSGTFDAAFLAVPVKLDGVAFTPYFVYAYAGDAAVARVATVGTNVRDNVLYGLVGANSTSDSRNAMWIGSSFEMKAFDPFVVYADVAYGKAGSNKDVDDRSGWLFDIAVDYTGFDFMTPEVFFVYTSGEDGNSSTGSKGSERMPVINSQYWAPGSFFFGNDTLLMGSKGFDNRQLGFWALGLSLKDISFIEKLKHTLTVMYVKGTNDKDYVKEGSTAAALRAFRYNLTLTEKDSLVEVDLNNSYQIYDELMATLDLGWINNDYSKSVWAGQYQNKADAYKMSVGLAYSF